MEQKTFYTLCCILLSFVEIKGASVGNANAAAPAAGAQQFTKAFSSGPPYVAHFSTDANTVRILAEVGTKGWVGFGFSPDGTMNNAELFIAGVEDSGKPYFGVYRAVGHSPTKIESGDWKLLRASENATATTVEVVRPLTANGHQIQTGEINVIWSIGANDDTTQMHAHRGPAKITLLPNVGENVVDVHGRAIFEEEEDDEDNQKSSGTKKSSGSGSGDNKQNSTNNATGCPPCNQEEDDPWWPYNSSPPASASALSVATIFISLVAAVFLK